MNKLITLDEVVNNLYISVADKLNLIVEELRIELIKEYNELIKELSE